MPEYSWPPMAKRRVMGKRRTRLDGAAKASGKAKYAYDVKPPGMLFGAVLTSPHAHARVKSVDASGAERLEGVTAVQVCSPAGTEIQWAGTEIAYVAATSEEIAKDAIRKIKVDYEVLPHLVREEDLRKAGNRTKPAGERIVGDPDKAFKDADVVSEGLYSIPVLTHCTMEAHGLVVSWKGDKVEFHPTTQAVFGIAGDLARALELPVTNVRAHQDHMGGGFGSKFSHDRWGVEAAKLSKASGGRPVKQFLDRRTELEIAGNRPSSVAQIKLAARKDGAVIGWDSRSWGTSGISGGGVSQTALPYVFTRIPNIRINHQGVVTNNGGARAWRAPNHPQASYLTCTALDDLGAKLNMDAVEFFSKNADLTPRPEVYRSQLRKAAEMVEWKKYWHPRGQAGSGPVKRGLGIGFGTWGGLGHQSQCRTTINADGSVVLELASQDLGTGTRTIICIDFAVAFQSMLRM